MATVGRDFGPYREWMTQTGVPTDYIKVIDSEHTAQAFITTDADDNQITAFHPGAMSFAHTQSIVKKSSKGPIKIGTISPDGRDGMILHATQFADATFVTYVRTTDAVELADGGRRAAETGRWVGRWRGGI